MSLLQLPLEILHQIAHHAGIESLAHLMLTCRHLHTCGQHRLIPDYHAKKQRFTHVAVTATDALYLLPDLADYLLGLAKYPEIAYFARSLTIGWPRPARIPQDNETKVPDCGLAWLRQQGGLNQTMGDDEAARLATEIVHRAAWVRENASVASLEQYVHKIKKFAYGSRHNIHIYGLEDMNDLSKDEPEGLPILLNNLIGLLFANLPHLVTFSCSWDLGHVYEEKGIIPLLDMVGLSVEEHAYAKKANGDANGDASLPGMHLKEFNYCPDTDARGTAKPELAKLAPFITLPHLRCFFASNLSAEYFPFQPVDCTIERLELVACDVNTSQLAQVLCKMPKLTVFRYSEQSASANLGYEGDWDVWSLVNAISEVRFETPAPDGKARLAEQLTELAIDAENRHVYITHGVGDALRRFTALNKLAINIKVFHVQSTRGWLRKDDEGGEPMVSPSARDNQNAGRALPRLVDILPASLEELELGYTGGRHSGAPSERVASGFKEERASKLPNLNKISVRGRFDTYPNGTISQKLVRTAEMLGVEWVSEQFTKMT